MCKIYTSSWGGTRKLPYAFTEQGIYMLMTVLRGELAVKQRKALVRIFKQMKEFITTVISLLILEQKMQRFFNAVALQKMQGQEQQQFLRWKT